jgi:2-(1,2-epoxy-1,2-dihydrophenyl)acetyl-CoA isomerase
MSNQAVLTVVKNGVALVTLNEPNSLNALSTAIVEGLTETFTSIKNDSTIRAVILTGNGRAFCAGGNIKGFSSVTSAAAGRKYMKEHINFLKDLAQMEKPVIAAVNGYAVGAGFSIALACDFVIASQNSKFSLGFHKLGLVPDLGGLYHLPRIVGMARAKELAFSDRTLSSYEAKEYGICLEVVEEGQLLCRAQEIAESFASSSTIAIGLAKSLLNHSFESSLDDILREEAMVQGIAFTTTDHKEGVRAFMEKTKPIFTGSYS